MAQGRSDCSVLLHFWDPVSNIIRMMTGQYWRLSPVCSQELKQEGNNGGLIPSVLCGACPRDGAVLSSWSRVAPSLLSCFHVADET